MTSRRAASETNNSNASRDAGTADKDAPPMEAVAPDTNVQLFLEAAGRACVHIEGWFRERSRQFAEQQAIARDHEAFQQARVAEVVQLFRQDRPKLGAEVAALVDEKKAVQFGLAADLAAHDTGMAEDRAQFEGDLAKTEARIAELTRDATEAEEWVGVSGPPARAQLEQLRDRIEEIALNKEHKFKLMQAEHEDNKRTMRENLVLRLRAVRDAAAADAAAAGSGGDNNNNNSGTAGGDDDAMAVLIGKPTTKTNERLTREVAVYVRESLALEHSLSGLQQQESALSAELLQKQTANEKLVLQNAASAKTKRILTEKLKELEKQLTQVEQDAETRLVERANSLVATSAQQASIIEDLNDEIDQELDNLLQLKSDLREAQQERLAQRRRARASARFFLTCSSDFGGDADNAFAAAFSEGDSSTAKKKEEEDTTVLFVPSANAAANAGGAGASGGSLGDVISGLGRVEGRKEASTFLMRLLQSSM